MAMTVETERQIELRITGNYADKFIGEHCGEFYKALGYACFWAAHAYPKASISFNAHSRDTSDGLYFEAEMSCLYTPPEGQGQKFLMVGIWRPQDAQFSFHS